MRDRAQMIAAAKERRLDDHVVADPDALRRFLRELISKGHEGVIGKCRGDVVDELQHGARGGIVFFIQGPAAFALAVILRIVLGKIEPLRDESLLLRLLFLFGDLLRDLLFCELAEFRVGKTDLIRAHIADAPLGPSRRIHREKPLHTLGNGPGQFPEIMTSVHPSRFEEIRPLPQRRPRFPGNDGVHFQQGSIFLESGSFRRDADLPLQRERGLPAETPVVRDREAFRPGDPRLMGREPANASEFFQKLADSIVQSARPAAGNGQDFSVVFDLPLFLIQGRIALQHDGGRISLPLFFRDDRDLTTEDFAQMVPQDLRRLLFRRPLCRGCHDREIRRDFQRGK